MTTQLVVRQNQYYTEFKGITLKFARPLGMSAGVMYRTVNNRIRGVAHCTPFTPPIGFTNIGFTV